MTIQSHHLHTHGPYPLYTPIKTDDVIKHFFQFLPFEREA